MPVDLSVLIVDDSVIVRQTVTNFLADLGYSNVQTANNGAEALKLAKDKLASGADPFDVIFLDRNMPEMDGMTFIKTYRNELNLIETAIIMLTAYSDQNSIIEALEAGAASYIIKPVSTETIKKKMEVATEWLGKRTQTEG
jgi:two-component system chemotaxis response regulator CheY